MSNGYGRFIRNEWKQVNQVWYYLGTDSYMKTGWQQLGGTWYYLDLSGAMAADTVVDGYALDKTGAMKK